MKSIRNYIAIYMSVTALITVLTVLVLRLFLKPLYPELLYLLPLYFAVLGVLSAWSVKVGLKVGVTCMQKNWLIYRCVKVLLSVAVLFVYAIMIRDNLVSFLVTFIVYYMVLMLLELIFMLNAAKGKVS